MTGGIQFFLGLWEDWGKLFDLRANVAELTEVVIKAGDWQIFSHGCGGDQAVHKMDLCSLEAVESV